MYPKKATPDWDVAFQYSRCTAAYSVTGEALSNTPPTIADSQCTPDSRRAVTIKTVNTVTHADTIFTPRIYRLSAPFSVTVDA